MERRLRAKHALCIANSVRTSCLHNPYEGHDAASPRGSMKLCETGTEKLNFKEPILLQDIANTIRSKNSGPFELTFDILFGSQDAYNRVCKANLLTAETVKKLFQIDDKDILAQQFFERALGWKCTTVRPWAQEFFGAKDVLERSSMHR
ncbi:uncharacterized protein Z518_02791 [Rhinocladiella mackenziei CBS 650.93]|uniref:Rhinocladiella mackenziei CBS 650.93 unplaced genomic scaffold supercont1.2, whole genome shotgun sequence n=1 Tax=Rhinocladiella mackenziei CBS 650.93 TaxID=1442369 RepID=A0A0D2JFQ8_9EURO|nr:uncharacterized protein Z518_02791 [Rhinocladiella mackenziei CBS 650.93]KIX08135.1 hypothetical protein Z518_02791 [Rhinocladiella mackenziei CBS 650.93]